MAIALNRDIYLYRTAILLSFLLPFIHYQPVTGVLVNTFLFFSARKMGWKKALLIGAITPAIASVSGWFSPQIALAIFCANTLLVVVFTLLRPLNYWMRMSLASIGKFLFFAITWYFLGWGMGLFIVLQLFTALAGGIIAKRV